MTRFQKKLRQLKAEDRLRSLKPALGIDLTSNDYLGFRGHPALRTAALEAIHSGLEMGAGGSRLLRGNTRDHESLENFAAQYFGSEKALFFATGFQANTAIFSTLCTRNDTILFDELIHASAREGIQSSHARHVKIPHNDLSAFEDALKKIDVKADAQIWIAVESVYSMDGDLAPLIELQKLAQQYDAYLIVDEAHGTGVFGASGKGVSENMNHERLITLHTCGKALGVAGGLVCASADIIDYLINCARPFVYSTAPPPLQAVLVERALKLVQEEPERRARLFALRDYANKILPVTNSPSQIIPILLGSDSRALQVAGHLQESGFDIRAIRPPTVPENTARLRLSLSVNIDESVLNDFAAVLTPYIERQAA